MRTFVSYASITRREITALVKDIEDLGYAAWFDQELTGGHAWWQTILNSIEQSDVFIFALTPQALDSYPCRLEYEYAQAIGKRILPVMLTQVNTNFLPPALSEIQYVDFRAENEDRIFALVRALNSLPPARPLPDPMPMRPSVPVSDIGRLKEKVESNITYSEPEQSSLLLDLKRFLSDPKYTDDARTLLKKMQTRRDTLAFISKEVDELLRTEPEVTAPRPPARRHRPAAKSTETAPTQTTPRLKWWQRLIALLCTLTAASVFVSPLVTTKFSPYDIMSSHLGYTVGLGLVLSVVTSSSRRLYVRLSTRWTKIGLMGLTTIFAAAPVFMILYAVLYEIGTSYNVVFPLSIVGALLFGLGMATLVLSGENVANWIKLLIVWIMLTLIYILLTAYAYEFPLKNVEVENGWDNYFRRFSGYLIIFWYIILAFASSVLLCLPLFWFKINRDE
jgi:hypothetical protein